MGQGNAAPALISWWAIFALTIAHDKVSQSHKIFHIVCVWGGEQGLLAVALAHAYFSMFHVFASTHLPLHRLRLVGCLLEKGRNFLLFT